jgi:hypothetical protein
MILMAEEQQAQQDRMLLELIRSRLPVVVQQGRFNTEDGVTATCIYARLSSGRAAPDRFDSNGLFFCPMIAAYLDGGAHRRRGVVLIGDACGCSGKCGTHERIGRSPTPRSFCQRR